MPSTSAITDVPAAGFTRLPGLQISPAGAVITNLKCYDFTLTDTGQVGTTSTERTYTIDGLSTSDIPIALSLSTGGSQKIGAINLRVTAADTLGVIWAAVGTTTGSAAGSAGGVAATLFTLSYFMQASSTTT